MYRLRIVGLLCLIFDLTSGDDITLNKNAVRNADLQIFIDTGTITNAVVLNKPDGSEEGRCLAPLGGTPGGCSANFAQSGTITTVTLSSVPRANHQGVWTSIHGSNNGNINITVLTIPTLTVSQTVSALTLSSSNTQSLTITAICAYPAVSLDLYFVPTGGGTAVSSSSSTSTCTSTGNAGCADTDAESYDCVIVPKPQTSITAGTYYVQFVVNLAGQYEPIGLNSTITDTVLTIEASRSSCDSCTLSYVLAAFGIALAVVCSVHRWMVHFQRSGKFQGPCSKFTNSKWSVNQTLITAIIVTILCVIGIILCMIGGIRCNVCLVTEAIVLVVVGFAFPFFTLVIVIILLMLDCYQEYMKKNGGQIITHQVKSNDPLTLTHTANDMATTPTHPADDKATTLTWTGPGGTLYVTGTTVEDDLHHLVKSRISVRYTGGSYTLTFTEVLSSDMGIYTSTVNGTVVKHEVIVQDNKAVRARPDGQDAKPRTERTPRSAGSPTSASNIKTKWRNNQVSDSNESDGSNDTPRRKLEDVPQGRKLPALELVDASQKANTLEPLEVNETKKLKKKKKRRSKEEKAQVISGNSDNERSDTQDVLLPHQVSDMSPPSGTQLRGTVQTDHSITRQEPGHEEKEGQTVDSHTNNTHL